MKILKSVLFLSLFAFLSCTSTVPQEGKKLSPKKEYLITLKTSFGDMRLVLFDQTPKHKANFVKLVQDGFFDGTLFHRVMNDFMIQGGDPSSKGALKGARLGNGGPNYKIPAEFVPEFFHKKGVLAAAREGDGANPQKQSNGSQFYIVKGKKWTESELRMLTVDWQKLGGFFMNYTQKEGNEVLKQKCTTLQAQNNRQAMMDLMFVYKDTLEQIYEVKLGKEMSQEKKQTYMNEGGYPSLDDNYTVFGMVIDGLDVLDKISAVKTDQFARPDEDIIMEMTLEVLTKKKITKLYGYEFD